MYWQKQWPQDEYKPRHEGPVRREPRFDPTAASFDVFSEARPYVPQPRPRLARPVRLDVLRSPMSLLIIAGMVDNPAPGTGRALAREANELPVFGETVRALGCAHLQVREVTV